MGTLTYRSDVRPPIADVQDLYRAAPLLRPILDEPRLRQMFEGATCVFTAWDGDRLVGSLRAITDGVYSGYICDLAVHGEYQGQGIGRRLLEEARGAHPDVGWTLRAAKLAERYYEHLGWRPIENGWAWPRPAYDLERDWGGPPVP